MKIVILYSGGLDSMIMLELAKKQYPEAEVKCIYFKHGAPSENEEIDLLPSHVIVKEIDWLNDECRPVTKKTNPLVGPIYIPGRNLVFATLAACQELPDEIWLGALVDEANEFATDKNREFLRLANESIGYVLSPFKDSIEVKFPFVERGWTKVDCVKWALESGVHVNAILSTVSCSFHDNVKACGECFQCVKRRLVMLNCGIDVVESYSDPITNSFGKNVIEGVKASVLAGSTDLDTLNMFKMIECVESM